MFSMASEEDRLPLSPVGKDLENVAGTPVRGGAINSIRKLKEVASPPPIPLEEVPLAEATAVADAAGSVPLTDGEAVSDALPETLQAEPEPEAAAAAEEGTPTAEEEEEEDVVQLTVVAPGVRVAADGTVRPTKDSKLGMLYVALLQHLLKPPPPGAEKPRYKWAWKRAPGARFDLFLSEAQGQSVPWKKLAVVSGYAGSAGGLPPPLVNYNQGFKAVCRKAMLVTTLRQHALASPEARVAEWLPPR